MASEKFKQPDKESELKGGDEYLNYITENLKPKRLWCIHEKPPYLPYNSSQET